MNALLVVLICFAAVLVLGPVLLLWGVSGQLSRRRGAHRKERGS